VIRACLFDVFGTVVDWHTSVSRDLAGFAEARGVTGLDWVEFAEEWRKLYNPAMEEVRSGRRDWTILDVLHREGLVTLLDRYGLDAFDEGEIDTMNRAWHRLDPWPDAVAGLGRLRRTFILATLSNGNVALIVNMARRAGLPWDAVLGAEVARHYKPEPEAYLTTAALLGLRPEQCMMVAAHNNDLAAARGVGFRTAFVPRPTEYGPGQTSDLVPTADWDVIGADFLDLARQLET